MKTHSNCVFVPRTDANESATVVRGSQIGTGELHVISSDSSSGESSDSSRITIRRSKRKKRVAVASDKAPKKRKALTPSFTKSTKRPSLARSEAKLVPPQLLQSTKGEDIGYSVPSTDWIIASMNKLVSLKNLANYCSLEGIRGPRAVMDSVVDELMGGGAKYNRSFVLLMANIILDQMEEPDEALYRILNALVTAKLLTPEAVAATNARHLKTIVAPHDKSLNTAWMVKLCKTLVEKNDGLVPTTPQDLLALGVKELSPGVANSVVQDAFGLFYGPVVDDYYGIRMAIALDLVDLEEYHFDKYKIDASNVDPIYVRESLLSWLPQQEWKGFHTLMVSTAQLLLETPDRSNREAAIKKIIRKKFGQSDKRSLLTMVDGIIKYFDAANGMEEEQPSLV